MDRSKNSSKANEKREGPKSWDIRYRSPEHHVRMCPKCRKVAKMATVCYECLDELQAIHADKPKFLAPANANELEGSVIAMREAGMRYSSIAMALQVEDEWVKSISKAHKRKINANRDNDAEAERAFRAIQKSLQDKSSVSRVL